MNKSWCKLNMKWTRITICVNKLEKCYPLDLYLDFFRLHWIRLMYDVMKKEWWQQGSFTKNFENEDLETKDLFPQQWPYEQCKREKCQIKGKWKRKSWYERGKCLWNKKILLILQHLHHMIKWSFANLPFHFDQIWPHLYYVYFCIWWWQQKTSK